MRKSCGFASCAVTRHQPRSRAVCKAQRPRHADHCGDPTVVRRLQAWAKDVVVELNLCPFAGAVVTEDRVRYVVCSEREPVAALGAVVQEAEALLAVDESDVATTILALTGCLQRFEEFYDFALTLEDLFEEDDRFRDKLMPAWFHPQNQWDGLEVDDPVNYDKRAPYPVINFLRTEAVDAVVHSGATANILDDNGATLRAQGSDRLRAIYEGLERIE